MCAAAALHGARNSCTGTHAHGALPRGELAGAQVLLLGMLYQQQYCFW